MSSAERNVVVWNAEVSAGAPVNYRKDDGSVIETFTRSQARVLGGHTAVVWLENVSGCVALDRVSFEKDRIGP